jgi:hypothetical protein
MARMNKETATQPINSLLLLCARPREDSSAETQIRALAESGLDWANLLAAAANHGMAPLVCQRLDAAAGEVLPPLWRNRFREEFLRNTRRNLALTGELFRVLGALEAHSVRAVPYKGPVLAAQAYGDISLRQFADLDIVVPQREIVEASRALATLGYSSDSDPSRPRDLRFIARGGVGQLSFSRKGGFSTVELHTEKTMRYFPLPLDWEELRPRLYDIRCGGRLVRTFSLEDTLCLLSVHGAKHFWERLGWICDVSNLTQLPQGVDWIVVEQIARRMRCWKMVLLGLAVATRMFESPLPERVLGAIDRDSSVQAMRRHVCADFFRRGESSGVARRLRFRLQSYETVAQGLRQCLRFATQPTEDDWKAVTLPRGLEPLYALVRPWRLLRKHGLGLGDHGAPT